MANTKKELAVAALENGTVIDHIPTQSLFKVVNLLGIKNLTGSVTIGFNLDSKKCGKKGIIKVDDVFFPEKTLNRIALIAPNAKINVISRKDIQNLYEHHVLHSLGIAKVVNFRDETTVMDLGTGGGFPGIPLAILFPHVQFHLVDSVGKKVKVANEVATAIGLKNVKFSHARAEEIKEQYDYVVVNDDLDECVDDIHSIVKASHCKSQDYLQLIDEIGNALSKNS